MTTTAKMLETHPAELSVDLKVLADCIDACASCAQVCTICADACLAEGDASLAECIAENLQCADVCRATADLLSRPAFIDWKIAAEMVAACASAAERCRITCAEHGEHGMEHCAGCADACRACADACRALLAQLNG
jgi:hypothetical protein